jgi:23S rRNA (guanosine2251-2'-O)-methyltransferase
MSDYIVYGRRPAMEFLDSREDKDRDSKTIEGIYIAESFPAKLLADLKKKVASHKFREFPKRKLDQMFPGINHQGVIIKLDADLYSKPTHKAKDWKEILEAKEGLAIALDRIQDVQNLGSIMRSAEALGARILFITGKGVTPNPVSDRISAGASFHLDHFVVPGLEHLISEAKKMDYWICTAASEFDLPEEMTEESILHYSDDFSGLPPSNQILLIIGNEGEGVKQITLRRSDYVVTIPLRGKTGSLNAGVAAGILIDRLVNRFE